MTPKDFVTTYLPEAQKAQVNTGISALAILAQAALETGWGKAIVGNMMFGVKASKDTPPEKKQLVTTTEYLKTNTAKFPEIISITKQPNGLYKYKVKDWFRKYDSPAESFTDHGNFFLNNPRYSEALKVKGDTNAFIDAIAKAGYATDPNYATLLKSIVQTIQKNIQ